jgi:PleD family two-component response regulator/EAL domain-containing protein (putative c-di-GMP-specific phosphodiesterase class I)
VLGTASWGLAERWRARQESGLEARWGLHKALFGLRCRKNAQAHSVLSNKLFTLSTLSWQPSLLPKETRPIPQHPDIDAAQVLLRALPKRMGAIVVHWRELKSGDWSTEHFDELYQQVQSLGEVASHAGLSRVSESAFALEVYLSTFGADQGRPGIERLQEAEALLRVLDSAAQSALRGKSSTGKAPSMTASTAGPIAYCLIAESHWVQGLDRALKANAWETRFFRDPGQLLAETRRHAPNGLVLEAAFLSASTPVLQELKQRRAAGKAPIPTVFISSSPGLQPRLAAMRAGADAYFAPPVETEAIARRLQQILVSRQQTAYRVLIVEDDPSQAKFAGTILRKAGMEAQIVTEALEVIRAIERFKPDLVLMDVYMPHASGVELTQIIRQEPHLVTLPIVYLSGEQDPERQQSALSVGADDFIVKPIRPKHLISTLANRIRRARQLQDGLTPAEASVDPKTGLATKQSFFDRVDALLGSGGSGGPLATIMHIDVRGAAELRAQLSAEDAELLIAMAGRRIANQLTETDAGTRSGEASFTVLLRQFKGRDLRLVANRLLRAISEPPMGIKGRRVRLAPSAGFWPLQRETPNGGGVSAPPQEPTVTPRQEMRAKVGPNTGHLQALVKRALQANNLRLVLQPAMDSSDQTPPNTYQVGLGLSDEALAPPAAVRKAAGQIGAGLEVDALLLDKSLQLLAQQRACGQEIQLLLNLSLEYMSDPESLSRLRDELRSRQLLGVGLIFVMPLHEVGSSPKDARNIARTLANMGIATALSQFSGSEAAVRVLKFLAARYVQIDAVLARRGLGALAAAIETAHKSGALVILPGESGALDLQARKGAAGPDLIIREAAQPVETALAGYPGTAR